MDTDEKVRAERKKPDPRAAALSRALRGELKISLTKVAAAMGRDWSTIGNFETSHHSIGPKTERRLLLFFAEAFAAKGVQVEPVPEDITLLDLRQLLARVLHRVQLARVVQQAGGAAQNSEAAELGEVNFFDRVIETSLELAGGRTDSPGVNARVWARVKEQDAKAAAAAVPVAANANE